MKTERFCVAFGNIFIKRESLGADENFRGNLRHA